MTTIPAESPDENGTNPQASALSYAEVNPVGAGVVNPHGENVNSDSVPLTVYAASQAMYAAGLNVVPVREDGSKTPELPSWRQYEKKRTTPEQIWHWFNSGQKTGIGVIYGAMSGNVELIEFEGRALAEGVFDTVCEDMQNSGLGEIWDRICTGWVGQSPSGGMHLRVRVTDGPVPGNTKLAERPLRDDELAPDQLRVRQQKPDKVFRTPLIETRGEGGFGVCEPSHGKVHPSGKPYISLAGGPHNIPLVGIETLRAIHGVLRMADQMPKQDAPDWRGRRPAPLPDGGQRPGDDYNARGDVGQLLLDHGWRYLYARGETSYWCRPGKTAGVSASVNYRGTGKLYVFTSSTEFDPDKAYSPFAAYAVLEHGGKYAEAAKALARQGFGDQVIVEPTAIPSPPVSHSDADEDMWAGINEDGMDEPPPPPSSGDGGSGSQGGGSASDPGSSHIFSSPEAPMRVARELEPLWTKEEGRTLHHWRDAWMSWTGTRYIEVSTTALKSRLYLRLEHAVFYSTNKEGALTPKPWNPAMKKISNLVEAVAATTHLPEKVESGMWLNDRGEDGLISCANVLVHPITRKTQPHSPAYFTTTSVPYAYDADARCPVWLNFLDEVFENDQEARDTIQEWAGYVISGRTDLQKGIQLIGATRAGKGTIARILEKLIGKENAVGSTLKSLGTNFGLQPLIDKSLCVIGDAHLDPRGGSEIVARLLMITGGDTMTIDRKNRAQWSGKMGARVMILANKAPSFQDASGAIVGRWITVNFGVSFLGREDPTLEGRLEKELPGIFNWALDGLKRLNERGRFIQPSSSARIIESQMEAASPVRAFVAERCALGAQEWITKEALFSLWRSWCFEQNQTNVGTLAKFATELYAAVAGINQTQRRINGRQTRMFTGITALVEPGMVTPPYQSTPAPAVIPQQSESWDQVPME